MGGGGGWGGGVGYTPAKSAALPPNQLDLWNPFLFACLLLFAIITTSTPNRQDKHPLIQECLFRSVGPAACLAVYKPWKSTGITRAHHHLWRYSKTGLCNRRGPFMAPGGRRRSQTDIERGLLSPHLQHNVITINWDIRDSHREGRYGGGFKRFFTGNYFLYPSLKPVKWSVSLCKRSQPCSMKGVKRICLRTNSRNLARISEEARGSVLV